MAREQERQQQSLQSHQSTHERGPGVDRASNQHVTQAVEPSTQRRTNSKKRNPIARAASAILSAFQRFRHPRMESQGRQHDTELMDHGRIANRTGVVDQGREGVQHRSDIPMDLISSTYTPSQTSMKAPFRTDGSDRSRDQEFAGGYVNEMWNEEDVYTNRSGDPRIGTHRNSASGKDRQTQD